MIFYCLLALFSLDLAHANIFTSIFRRGISVEEEESSTTQLPRVLPSEDKSFLISFVSDEYDHCKQMEPVLKRLEDDLGTVVRRINIFRRREFMGLLEAMGHNDCGTLPFYYNRRTGQAICGATSYLNLKRWGTGDLKHSFMDPPEGLSQGGDENYIGPSSRRSVGNKGFLLDKLQGLERRGKERAERVSKLEQIRKSALEKKKLGGGKKSDEKKQEIKIKSGDTKEMTAAKRTATRKAARDMNKK
jgi:hypothetical protein